MDRVASLSSHITWFGAQVYLLVYNFINYIFLEVPAPMLTESPNDDGRKRDRIWRDIRINQDFVGTLTTVHPE